MVHVAHPRANRAKVTRKTNPRLLKGVFLLNQKSRNESKATMAAMIGTTMFTKSAAVSPSMSRITDEAARTNGTDRRNNPRLVLGSSKSNPPARSRLRFRMSCRLFQVRAGRAHGETLSALSPPNRFLVPELGAEPSPPG